MKIKCFQVLNLDAEFRYYVDNQPLVSVIQKFTWFHLLEFNHIKIDNRLNYLLNIAPRLCKCILHPSIAREFARYLGD